MSLLKSSYWIFFVIALAMLSFVGCGEDCEQKDETTSITAKFNFAPSLLAAQAPDRVVITIEADDMDRIIEEFPFEGNPMTVIVENVPIGPNRRVRVEAWSEDKLLAIGEDDVNIAAQEVNRITILMRLIYPELLRACVGYWGFNEGGGDIAGDFTGHDNRGRIIGNPGWVSGKFGLALEFHGVAKVVVPHNESLNIRKTLTIMAWVAPMSPDGSIVGKERTYGLGLIGGKLVWLQKPLVDEPTPLQNWVYTEFAPIPLHDWVHVAFVYDYGRNERRLYLNGELESVRPANVRIPISDGNFVIGGFMNTPGFEGVIDELSLWNRALTKMEIKSMMDWDSTQ